MKLAYHASHEQFPPDRLLRLAKTAEAAGFAACVSSDHFHPWSEKQGQSGFAWSWLGAALEATSMPIGVISSPGQRYHPAVIAQASATLCLMYPGRFWLAIGSGELLNEKITGDAWPAKSSRNRRLLECAQIIRALWHGETVTHRGLVNVVEARLYSLPDSPPPLFGAALTESTAGWLGQWADGMVTASISAEQLRPIMQAFISGAGNHKPVYVKLDVSYDPDEQQALQAAWEHWRAVTVGSLLVADLRSPEHFEQAARFVRPEDVRKSVAIISDMAELKDLLDSFQRAGVDLVSIHNVNPDQESFLTDFAVLQAAHRE